jgi:hypothetical protein
MKNKDLSDAQRVVLFSRVGWEYYFDDNEWRLDKNVIIPIKSLCGYLEKNVEIGCVKTLSWFANTVSAHHVQSMFYRFLHYLKTCQVSEITTTSLINFKHTLDKHTEWYLGTIRVLLLKWHRLGYPGVSDEVVSLLKNWRLKGNIKGDVVKRLDPVQGPLSDLELQAFNECAVQLFEQDKISFDEMAMALITSHTGRRPVQVSHLRVRDVLRGKNKSNGEFHLINIPKAKQSDSVFRDQFEQFAITETLYAILVTQANDAIGKIHKKLGYELQEHDKC